MPTPVILDCDPGHDDAVAILLAAAHPAIDLRAITTVAGNQTLEKCTRNARRLCTVAGVTDVPIAAGADRPLHRSPRIAGDIHGETGLDGPDLPEPAVPVVDEPAVALMYRLLMDSHEPMTLIPTGPLTNVAQLLQQFPQARERIAEIVLMGGSTGRGNATPYAEFNILVDPEAAAIVFASGLPLTMVGLNVTHQARVTPDVIGKLKGLDTPVATLTAGLLTFYADSYHRVFGFDAPPLHDPVAVARVIDPDLVPCVSAPVAIETAGTHTAGATVVDLHHVTGENDNALVAIDVDAPRFFDVVVEAVRTYR